MVLSYGVFINQYSSSHSSFFNMLPIFLHGYMTENADVFVYISQTVICSSLASTLLTQIMLGNN